MKTVLSPNYTPIFTPGAPGLGKIDFTGIPGFVNNRLMAVFDQTINTLIYAEGLQGFGGYWDTTTKILTLSSNTTTSLSSNLLQVVFDSQNITVTPAESQFDAINKQRISMPSSLIDTDFEYGLQPQKWEFLQLSNNRPTAFYNSTNPILVGALTANGSRTVTVSSNTYPGSGVPFYVQESLDPNVNGWYMSDYTFGQSGSNWTFTVAVPPLTVGSILDYTRTLLFPGYYFTGSGIPVSQAAGGFLVGTTGSPNITATTLYAHNLTVGNPIYIIGCTDSLRSATTAINGAFTVYQTPSANTFTFNISAGYNGTSITATSGVSGTLLVRPNGYAVHRAFDGGVFFTCGAGSSNALMIRQTRRYFRYQSGKGMNFSTGSILKPAMFVNNMWSTPGTTTVSVSTKYAHGVAPGMYVNVSGVANDNAYNGTYQVTGVVNPNTFTYTTSSNTTIGFGINYGLGTPITISPQSWYGQAVRVGMFDSQNGVFFELDGQTLYVVRRSSTSVLQGSCSVTQNSNVLSGNGTYFSQQLKPNDNIVLRGQTYKVSSILSDTILNIVPEYKGVTLPAGVVITKTVDLKIPQSQWNLDRLDGTGQSGYNIDLTKMQMLCIDYSWYGAGFIRWGVRGIDGNYIYCHKLANNNVNTVAYMRSGNLPARYEENTSQPSTVLAATLNYNNYTVNVSSTAGFPVSGTARIVGAGNNAPIEYFQYNNINLTTLFVNARGVFGGGPAVTWNYNPSSPILIELTGTGQGSIPPAAALAHWGSSVIMDGGFQSDLSYSFNTGSYEAGHPSLSAITSVAAGRSQPLLSIRLAPSVDSGRPGILGAREIINRMQLKLKSIDAITTGLFRLNFILNGQVLTNQTWQTIVDQSKSGTSSLAQVCYHSSLSSNTLGTIVDGVSGGENIYGFYVSSDSSAATKYSQQTVDLSSLRDMGTSILGGGLDSKPSFTTFNVYPDGPDVVTVTATNLGTAASNIGVRLSWEESQA